MKLNDIAKEYKVNITEYVKERGTEGIFKMGNCYISTDENKIKEFTDWCEAISKNAKEVKEVSTRSVKKRLSDYTELKEMIASLSERLVNIESKLDSLSH